MDSYAFSLMRNTCLMTSDKGNQCLALNFIDSELLLPLIALLITCRIFLHGLSLISTLLRSNFQTRIHTLSVVCELHIS